MAGSSSTVGLVTLSRRSRLYDAVLAIWLMLFSVSLLSTFFDSADGTKRVLGVALIVIHTGAIAYRRVAPWPVLVVNLATAIGVVSLDLPPVVLHLTPLVALYSVAAEKPRSSSKWGLLLAVATLVTVEAIGGWSSDGGTVIGNLVGLTATWLFGSTVHERKRYVAQLEERTRELEEARLQLAERAVAEERLRIARELHDVVAHNLSMIAVQSGMGAHVIDRDPAEAKNALEAIEEGSREALDEMRRLVGVLRGSDRTMELAPAPGVDQVPALVERVGANGPAIVFRVVGEPDKLPPGVDLTAYRIVQESLTNVLKHAHAKRVRVTLSYGQTSLVLEIVDDGAGGSSEAGTGHGLDGMRERVLMYGGTMDAGPLEEGGFRVRAELPLDGADR
jgi:signal transduction histidine kinase